MLTPKPATLLTGIKGTFFTPLLIVTLLWITNSINGLYMSKIPFALARTIMMRMNRNFVIGPYLDVSAAAVMVLSASKPAGCNQFEPFSDVCTLTATHKTGPPN